MAACTFFGHRDCPDTIRTKLQETLIELITLYGVDMFYVGNQGQFDAIVRSVLGELRTEYPQINYAVVLAYMPGAKNENYDFSDTMLPEGIENIHPRYAISWRNNWMLHQSEYVVTYITHTWGCSAQFAKKAQAMQKVVVKFVNQG